MRTVPNGVYDALPRGDYRILEAYIRALRSAEHLVYLESQFLWAPEVVDILRAKLRNPPTDDFHVIVLLPASPNNGADDTRGQLGLLVDADRNERFLACTLYQPTHADQVYVHAKIGIVDDRWLVVGSANLNEHSFYNDTEACVITCDEELARATRLRLWREHLGCDDVELRAASASAPRTTAYDRLALLPHVSRRTRQLPRAAQRPARGRLGSPREEGARGEPGRDRAARLSRRARARPRHRGSRRARRHRFAARPLGGRDGRDRLVPRCGGARARGEGVRGRRDPSWLRLPRRERRLRRSRHRRRPDLGRPAAGGAARRWRQARRQAHRDRGRRADSPGDRRAAADR